MINAIFANAFVKIMEKMESYKEDLNYSLPMVGAKPSMDIYLDCLRYADEYAASIPEMDDNTYVMVICSIIAQKHMCRFWLWDTPKIIKEALCSKFVDDNKIKYFQKIDEAFFLMGEALGSRRREYIEGFCEEFDFFQTIQEADKLDEFLKTMVEAIAICPQYEYAYCFLVVEYASLFMGSTFDADSSNGFSEYYYKASQVLDETTFDYLFSGNMDCSFSGKKLFDKYKGIYREEDLDVEKRRQYHLDLQFYKKMNGYIDFLDNNEIKDGCVQVNNKKYKIGVPYLKFIPTEEKSNYLTEYFVEEDTVGFEMGDDVTPNVQDFNNNVIYRDAEKTYRAKRFQMYRGFSYYMPKMEWAPLYSVARISSYGICNLTKIMMEHSQRELDIYRKNLSIQSKLSRLRSDDMSEDEIDKIIETVVSSYEKAEGNNENRKGIASERVKNELGDTTWNRISAEVKKMLISAEISYDSLKDIKDVDYSPAVISLTKAVENILNEYIYHGGIYQYLCNHDLSGNSEYARIYHRDRETRRKCPDESVTIGAFKYMFDNYATYAGETMKEVLRYDELDNTRIEIIEKIKCLLANVCEHRNHVAHKDGVDSDIMEECRKEIMTDQYAIIKNIFKLF